jgi:hypothetical protein
MTFDDDQPKWQVIYRWAWSRLRFRIKKISGLDLSVADTVRGEHSNGIVRILMFAAMVGGLTLSRAMRNVDASGSTNILRAVRNQLGLLVDS